MSRENDAKMNRIPLGIWVIKRIRGKNWSLKTYRYVILLVTFIAYTCYHASRKPSSIVKSVLDPEKATNDTLLHHHPWPVGGIFIPKGIVHENSILRSKLNEKKGWAPFNEEDGTSKLGEIDLAFLACYSMGMYVAGHLGDRLDLRLFLTTGMVGSGIFVALFGMGYFLNIHVFWFYLVMQMFAGLFQATGWPSVVAIVGNWFGMRKRGLIMGIWNAHTSVGNISGSLMAAAVLQYGWGWSFIVPGGFIFLGGIMVFLFLAAYPEDVGFSCTDNLPVEAATVSNDEEAQLGKDGEQSSNGGGQNGKSAEVENGDSSAPKSLSKNRRSVGLIEACLIPGVIPFALCLFFAKLVAYTFLYWLPFYLSQTAIGGEYMSVKSAGNLSTLFDVGGIVGGILAGYISDKSRSRATTAATFMYAAIPSMLIYRKYGSLSQTMNIVLMMTAGLFVNGPYALITTAVSADLGTHSSIRGDSRALATVTAIIDGTGSIGAALGPLLTGFLSTKGWNAVFAMLIVGALAAGLLLSRLVVNELAENLSRSRLDGRCNPEGSTSEPLLANESR